METAVCKREEHVLTTASSGNAIKHSSAAPTEVSTPVLTVSPGWEERGLAGPEPLGGRLLLRGVVVPPGSRGCARGKKFWVQGKQDKKLSAIKASF